MQLGQQHNANTCLLQCLGFYGLSVSLAKAVGLIDNIDTSFREAGSDVDLLRAAKQVLDKQCWEGCNADIADLLKNQGEWEKGSASYAELAWDFEQQRVTCGAEDFVHWKHIRDDVIDELVQTNAHPGPAPHTPIASALTHVVCSALHGDNFNNKKKSIVGIVRAAMFGTEVIEIYEHIDDMMRAGIITSKEEQVKHTTKKSTPKEKTASSGRGGKKRGSSSGMGAIAAMGMRAQEPKKEGICLSHFDRLIFGSKLETSRVMKQVVQQEV